MRELSAVEIDVVAGSGFGTPSDCRLECETECELNDDFIMECETECELVCDEDDD